jgi:Zn-dependent protease with chaperone function
VDVMYPAGPEAVPAAFTRPSASYRRHAWIAVASLLLFIGLYLALTVWFIATGWSELAKVGSADGFLPALAGAASLFLAAFLIKALFFMKKGAYSGGIELTRVSQPRLFAFLDRIADEAGAPRPHKVFATARVNAAVFYDLSLLNLLFPSRKNLEIGLGLVNMLNLGELKAVLAHEFGHFAQRSMAVGRWVYTTQQIAAHIVGKRDALDGFLRQLSRLDIRIAWIGWLLGTIIWALRAVVDMVFRLVVIAQRALSREMEMQADLVAVSLTGSDALITALHRLQMADDAWERSLSFLRGELNAKQPFSDVFMAHQAIADLLGGIYNDAAYGRRPQVPTEGAASFRVFNGELAQPPRMWSTHPMNHEREHNAKRTYLFAPVDDRSAWSVFDDAAALRERMTRELIGETTHPFVDADVTLERLRSQFGREHLKTQYRGMYLGFSPVRHAKTPGELHEDMPIVRPISVDELYPATISEDLEQLRSLEREHALLCSLRDRIYDAPDGVIRHRGRILQRHELPTAISAVGNERTSLRARLESTAKTVRSQHLAAAARISPGWHAYLRGLLSVLHYADHAEANLRDAQTGLATAYRNATARGAINEKGVRYILAASNDVYRAMSNCFNVAAQVLPGENVLAELGCTSWHTGLGELRLQWPARANINEWLRLIDGWIGHTAGALGALRRATLDELLVTEAIVAAATRGTEPPDAPVVVPSVPPSYDILLTGAERAQSVDTDPFWERFLTAHGFFPALTRTIVALAIVGSVLAFGWMVDRATVTAYNGLERPVVTTIDGHRLELAPHAHGEVAIGSGHDIQVVTQASDGEPIESFAVPVGHTETQLVYTVAGATPLRSWTAVYGNVSPVPPQFLAPQRWQGAKEQFIFAAPPEKIESKSGGGTRTVLDAADDIAPQTFAGVAKSNPAFTNLVLAHVRFDAPGSSRLSDWLAVGAPLPGFDAALAARRAHFPGD